MQPKEGMKILDLGGQPEIWDNVGFVLNITCVNLPGVAKSTYKTHHNIQYIEGDACSMPHFNRGDFDIVFSNSVIEHVGDLENRRKFSEEVLRISDNYWIQTPSKFFPIEAHCGMLLWWFYPEALRQHFIKKWFVKLPAWTEMVASTTVLSKTHLAELFPHATIVTEWFVFPKAYIAYAVSPAK